jgi:hypothetical protein
MSDLRAVPGLDELVERPRRAQWHRTEASELADHELKKAAVSKLEAVVEAPVRR